jgi:hypothetical protein
VRLSVFVRLQKGCTKGLLRFKTVFFRVICVLAGGWRGGLDDEYRLQTSTAGEHQEAVAAVVVRQAECGLCLLEQTIVFCRLLLGLPRRRRQEPIVCITNGLFLVGSR